MKQFILEVQEGNTDCEQCPFSMSKHFYHICDYLCNNKICHNYDFSQINIKEYDENNTI